MSGDQTPFARCELCGTIRVNLSEHKRNEHGIEPTRRQQTCRHCGQPFARDRAGQVCCSAACRKALRGQR